MQVNISVMARQLCCCCWLASRDAALGLHTNHTCLPVEAGGKSRCIKLMAGGKSAYNNEKQWLGFTATDRATHTSVAEVPGAAELGIKEPQKEAEQNRPSET